MKVLFSASYIAAAQSFDTTRKAGALAADLLRRPLDGVRITSPEPASRDDLLRIHDEAYVDAVLTGEPRILAASAGLGWDPGFVEALLASTGGCIAAAGAAWADGVSGSLSSGLHHARRHRGCGFCTFNGVAAAVLTFLDPGARRLLVVDLDAHAGGGTHDILGSHPAVSQLDIVTNPFDEYDAHDAWTLDFIPLAEHYLGSLAIRLDALDPAAVDAVVYNAGMDPHEHCATGGLEGITRDLLADREHLVFSWARTHRVPIAFVLAGGYAGGDLGVDGLTALHRLTVEAAAAAATPEGPAR
jgi:acetoin utilization deacetylase AcuC-like enzyme